MDDNINRPNSDADSLVSFDFDAPAEIDPEGADFSENPVGSNPSRRMPESIRNLGIMLNKKRRAAVQRVMRGGATGCYDQDDSGTYDPKRKRATPDLPKNVGVKKQKIHSEGENDEDGEKELKLHRKVGYSLMVTLTLESEQGREYLRGITPGPSDTSDTSQDEESKPETDTGDGSLNKRRRRRREPERLGATYSRADGLALGDLTVDHPQRRGCKACFEAGDDECTLIEHKFEYPCESCRDGSLECELIIPPELKKSCQRCKQKRRSCSYISDGGKGVETCDQCADEGVKCCAGPLKLSKKFDRTTSRRIGAKPSAVDDGGKVVERMWVACNQCRVLGRRCTLKGKQDFGPCSGCRKKNEQCKFVLPRQRQPRLSAAPDLSSPRQFKQPKIEQYFSRKRGEGPETPEEKNSRKGPGVSSPATNTRNLLEEVAVLGYKQGRRALKKGQQLISRKTEFCHPIQFNYIPDPEGSHPCDWCLSPFFGFYGLAEHSGPRIVEGYWLENGEGFKEVRGGFADPEVDGQVRERTRMCVGCTFERIRIFACSIHTIRPLANTEQNPDVWDNAKWDYAATALENGDEVGGALMLNSKWCSICAALASFTCSSITLFTSTGEAGQDEGCGLLLCSQCQALTHHTFREGIISGSETLDAIFREVSTNKFLYPTGVRADAEFLTSGGELVMRINQGMDMGRDENAEAEEGNAGYGGQGGQGGQGGHGGHGGHGGFGDFGGGQDRKKEGISTTFGPRPPSTPAREGQCRAFREEQGFSMNTPPANPRTPLRNALDGGMVSTPKWKGKGKEVDRGSDGYGYGGGYGGGYEGGGGGWNITHNPQPQPHPQMSRAPSNAGQPYHQNSYVSTNPHASPGWMDYRHNKVMHSTAGPAYHQSPYVSTNPNPQLPPQTPRSFSNAGPSYPQTPYISQNPNNPGDRMNNTHNPHPYLQTPRQPSNAGLSQPTTPHVSMRANLPVVGLVKIYNVPNTHLHGNFEPLSHQHQVPPNIQAGPIKSEVMEEGNGGMKAEAGAKIPFFDKQTGVWRDVEVVDLGDE